MAHDEIFDLDKTRDRSRLRQPEADQTPAGLEALVGRPRMSRGTDDVGHDLPRLVAMVEAAAANRAPMPASSAPSSVRRSRRRIDWVSTLAGAAAVVAVSVASSFAVVQAANASPTGDATALLRSDQDAVISAELGLTASRVRIEEQIAAGATAAQTFETGLAALVPTEEEQPFVEPAVFEAAASAATQYQVALEAITVPEALPAWTAPPVDEESLASVAAAIDEVQARAALVDDASAEVRSTRQSLEGPTATFAAGVSAFRASVSASTQAVLDDAPFAEQSLRDALSVASTAVGSADLTTAAGAAALEGYRDAVRAVRDDKRRAAEEAERQRVEDQRRYDDTQTEQPTDPVTEEPTPPEDPTAPTEPDQGDGA